MILTRCGFEAGTGGSKRIWIRLDEASVARLQAAALPGEKLGAAGHRMLVLGLNLGLRLAALEDSLAEGFQRIEGLLSRPGGPGAVPSTNADAQEEDELRARLAASISSFGDGGAGV